MVLVFLAFLLETHSPNAIAADPDATPRGPSQVNGQDYSGTRNSDGTYTFKFNYTGANGSGGGGTAVPGFFVDGAALNIPCNQNPDATGGRGNACTFGLDSCKDRNGKDGVESWIIKQAGSVLKNIRDYRYMGVKVDPFKATKEDLAALQCVANTPVQCNFSNSLPRTDVANTPCNILAPTEDPKSACAGGSITGGRWSIVTSSKLITDIPNGVGNREVALLQGLQVELLKCHEAEVFAEVRTSKLHASPECLGMVKQLAKFYTPNDNDGRAPASKSTIDLEGFRDPRNAAAGKPNLGGTGAFFNHCHTEDKALTTNAKIAELTNLVDPTDPNSQAKIDIALEKYNAVPEVREHLQTAYYLKAAEKNMQALAADVVACEVMARADTAYNHLINLPDSSGVSPFAYAWKHSLYNPISDRAADAASGCKSSGCAKSRAVSSANRDYGNNDPNCSNCYYRFFKEFQQKAADTQRGVCYGAKPLRTSQAESLPGSFAFAFMGFLLPVLPLAKRRRGFLGLSRETWAVFLVFPFMLHCGGGGGGGNFSAPPTQYVTQKPPEPGIGSVQEKGAEKGKNAAGSFSKLDRLREQQLAAKAGEKPTLSAEKAAPAGSGGPNGKAIDGGAGSGRGLAGGGGGGGALGAGGGGGSGFQPVADMQAGAVKPTEEGKVPEQLAASAYQQGGGRGGREQNTNTGAGLFGSGTDAIGSNAPKELGFGEKGVLGNPIGEDPSDYFSRIGVYESIFKIVERKYSEHQRRWATADAESAARYRAP